MQYEEFLNKVQDRIGPAQPEEAERAMVATFDTLGECISGGEASDLATNSRRSSRNRSCARAGSPNGSPSKSS